MEQAHGRRWTVYDLEQFEDVEDGTRYELIDGELYISSAPHWMHQYISVEVAGALRDWSSGTGAGMVLPTIGLIFAEDEAVIPDIVWVAAHRLAEVLGSDGKLHAPPDLVVELLSAGWANERRDRVAKLDAYSRRGVREYWIVDWRECCIEVHRRQGSALRPAATLQDGQVLESPLLPGFRLELARLFADRGNET
jgi:Uma2 family endonuclease